MNLQKLFDAQKVLRERIDYNEPDRFEKLILALLVEVGECANEYRAWKFWSKDQQPRTDKSCWNCGGKGKGYFSGAIYSGLLEKCTECEGTGRDKKKNPLLEEYVDGFHFILELGIELDYEEKSTIWVIPDTDGTECFNSVFRSIVMLDIHKGITEFQRLLSVYYRLGEKLGFTPKQIETAYFSKNQINHQRQEEGY